jgi:type I site-specific restriction endonuclease
MPHTPEAFARVLIDQALKDSGWDSLDTKQVRLEVSGKSGRSDYILLDLLTRPLCVLEAKKEDEDPYDAKEQARGYAENLQAPFVILSNGREHWFWNYERADERDAYRIERLPSRADLERLRLKNLQPPRALQTEIITPVYLQALNPEIRLRGYQIRAIDEVSRQFDQQRQAQVSIGDGNRHRQDAVVRCADPPLFENPPRRACAVHRGSHRTSQASDGGFQRHLARI